MRMFPLCCKHMKITDKNPENFLFFSSRQYPLGYMPPHGKNIEDLRHAIPLTLNNN